MSNDNSYGRGYFPLPARLAGLGRFADSLKPGKLVSHKFFVEDGVHMLTVKCGHGLSVMRQDLASLLDQGLLRIQSNDSGELSFYFLEAPLWLVEAVEKKHGEKDAAGLRKVSSQGKYEVWTNRYDRSFLVDPVNHKLDNIKRLW